MPRRHSDNHAEQGEIRLRAAGHADGRDTTDVEAGSIALESHAVCSCQLKREDWRNAARRSVFGAANISRGFPSSPMRPPFMKMTRLDTS
ncbi:hypothetical protein SAMN05216525_103328 [Bradyrhizobium sp. Gha]|nr:hypothetical protein SAMN05216525_103328 [Bradyrhizobium sp. Gha]